MSDRVVFILSSGRSGSTLLEMLLGSHPQLWSVGEVQLLARDRREVNQLCGCGVPVSKCEFWNDVIERSQLDQEQLDFIGYFRWKHPNGRVIMPYELPYIGKLALPEKRIEWNQSYAKLNQRLFHAIYSRVRIERKPDVISLIDSSKDLYRCNALIASGVFRVHVIHLVKDPRAFVYSMIRHENVNAWTQTLRKTLRWHVENALAERVYRGLLPSERYMKVYYEDLAGKPEETLEKIWHLLRIDSHPEAVHQFRSYTKHDISGNPMKFEDRPITLDEKWKTQMPWLSKWFVNFATWRFDSGGRTVLNRAQGRLW